MRRPSEFAAEMPHPKDRFWHLLGGRRINPRGSSSFVLHERRNKNPNAKKNAAIEINRRISACFGTEISLERHSRNSFTRMKRYNCSTT
jgi:hypothetical protein